MGGRDSSTHKKKGAGGGATLLTNAPRAMGPGFLLAPPSVGARLFLSLPLEDEAFPVFAGCLPE